jgi:uncharacterized surface anchored protein
MKKLIVIGATALATLFVVLGVAPSAYAYPEGVCDLEVSAQVVNSGETITATCTYSVVDNAARKSALSDTNWVMTFNGETRTGTGETFTQSFVAPEVTEPTTFPLKSTGTGDAGTCSRTVNITILPNGQTEPPKGPHMPNTGGPRLILLIAGLGLVVAGAIAIRQSRKSHDGHHAL